MEPGLEAVSYYDPPNMTYPFGAYICVMDIDVDTGVYKVRRFYALDDCGTRINPMIIEGQVHGGLTEAFAIAMGQEIRLRRDRQRDDRLVHGFLPADRGGDAEVGNRLSRSRRRRITRSARKGVGESPHVGGVPASPTPSTMPSRFSKLDPHPDAARFLAELEGGEATGSGGLRVHREPAP